MSEVFKTLAAVDCSDHTEKKGKFTYLSWTWAWSLVKSKYPDATFEKHIFRDNQDNPLPFMRDTKGFTYVATTVVIEGVSHTEVFAVTYNKNPPMTHPDSFSVNTALQRCLVKTLAFHGLGLNVYAGEDLPVMDQEANVDNVTRIVNDIESAESVDAIDSKWKSNQDIYKKLGKKDRSTVINAFKKVKIALQEKTKEAA